MSALLMDLDSVQRMSPEAARVVVLDGIVVKA
jgi:hypothetical protein